VIVHPFAGRTPAGSSIRTQVGSTSNASSVGDQHTPCGGSPGLNVSPPVSMKNATG
jgi:hypothetical protein